MELAFLRDFEAKLDACRMREFSLAAELDKSRLLILELQKENAIFHEREREAIFIQEEILKGNLPPPPPPGQFLPEQAIVDPINSKPNGEDIIENEASSPNFVSAEMQEAKIVRLMGINESLQDKVKLLENRLSRMEDDLEAAEAAREITAASTSNSFRKEIVERAESELERSESYRRSLVWQKRFLLLLLNSHKQRVSGGGGGNSAGARAKNKSVAMHNARNLSAYFAGPSHLRARPPKTRFRIAVFVVRAHIRFFTMIRDAQLRTLNSGGVSLITTDL